jgi:hypothetical protein
LVIAAASQALAAPVAVPVAVLAPSSSLVTAAPAFDLEGFRNELLATKTLVRSQISGLSALLYYIPEIVSDKVILRRRYDMLLDASEALERLVSDGYPAPVKIHLAPDIYAGLQAADQQALFDIAAAIDAFEASSSIVADLENIIIETQPAPTIAGP